jgi:crotonobetainyl-CoA:carnitine CoA-transferase CaiB-like acyl-CoA transferase
VIPFATVALARLFGGEMPRRGAEYLTGGIAAYNTYFSKDGEAISLGALEPKFLQRFCAGAGLEFDARAIVPGPHQAALKASFAEAFASRTRAEWEQFAEEHDCCVEPVLRPDELLSDPQLAARGAFVEARSGEATFHEYRTPVTPRDERPRPAPRVGEHTELVLGEAGFSPEEISRLRSAGAVR